MDNIYNHVENMFRFLNYAKRECNDIIEDSIKECIRKVVLTDFTDESGMINPTIQMIEVYNKSNIHIIVKRIKKIGIEYAIRYEDGINDDIEIVLNPGGEL